ncbi:MAG TPA: hypothetical protein PLU20_08065 [Ornithinibacter sp.]|mgnify:CR=1 FL=1|jgi:hypothetical protein|nr:hypothetical protein [Ornithinibacter sp.]HPV90630.1 hypothetical protein [Ornithinibacter sp.]HQG17434.1 hypothetical protein [Ornithinibacter sp.]
MDSFAAAGDRGSNADPQSAGPKEAVMWWLIIGVVLAIAAMAVVISRRGPGDGLDHSLTNPLDGAGHSGLGSDGGAGA